ncbi:MAG: hypothetical protein KY451_11205 [Actinobacteria bacterium]|nr:hypothetical protein [Actinomycetota bacterium]
MDTDQGTRWPSSTVVTDAAGKVVHGDSVPSTLGQLQDGPAPRRREGLTPMSSAVAWPPAPH